jgi:hypothetical protein
MKRVIVQLRRGFAIFAVAVIALSTLGCEDVGKKSASKAKAHIEFLVKASKRDVEEVRKGLPVGAKLLAPVFDEVAPERPAAVDVREELLRVRSANDDLDSAKSTFFLVAAADGEILRNNLDTDEMAGKNLFEVYPEAKSARKKGYFEFTGSWEIARGVNGRPDAQWVAVSPILTADGKEAGLFAAGWSWSSYAYRLEMSLRSDILSSTEEGHKVPLLYVYVLVGEKSYGTPIAPVTNGVELLKLRPHEKVKGEEIWTRPLTIERREFGVAIQRVVELGENVLIAVLRSET